MGKKMRTTPRKLEVMKSVIGVVFTLLALLATTGGLGSAQQVQVPFNPSPTFDPGAPTLDSRQLQQRLLNSAGAYLPGLGFKYPSFNQDILR